MSETQYFETLMLNIKFQQSDYQCWLFIAQVDLEGLVANLTEQISWFKFVGNVTLSCAAEARERDTLMEVAVWCVYLRVCVPVCIK